MPETSDLRFWKKNCPNKLEPAVLWFWNIWIFGISVINKIKYPSNNDGIRPLTSQISLQRWERERARERCTLLSKLYVVGCKIFLSRFCWSWTWQAKWALKSLIIMYSCRWFSMDTSYYIVKLFNIIFLKIDPLAL